MFKGLMYLLILLSCENKLRPSHAPDDPVITDTLYRMDILHPTVTQSLKSIGPNPGQFKFVEIVITQAVNPKEYPASFTVHYRDKEIKEPVLLGMFSLYPANNPGTFIVSTLGRLADGGVLELRLEHPEDFKDGDAFSFEVKEMRLVKGEE